jgi:hypothetical protein
MNSQVGYLNCALHYWFESFPVRTVPQVQGSKQNSKVGNLRRDIFCRIATPPAAIVEFRYAYNTAAQ